MLTEAYSVDMHRPLQSTIVEGGMPVPDCSFRVIRAPDVAGRGVDQLILGDVGTLIWEIASTGMQRGTPNTELHILSRLTF